jgi:uncharacterized protein (DUF697 family)
MWQLSINILLGVGLMFISFVGSMIGSISNAYAWTFGIMGLIILVASIWGLIDEINFEQTHRRFDSVL